jgi:CRISPR-associated protein Cas6
VTIDLAFPLVGDSTLPSDHGYLLYSAISRIAPCLHGDRGVGIHPIPGRQIGARTLQLCRWSRLVVRASAERIADLLPLAGSQLIVLDRPLRVGVPQVRPLVPAGGIRSRLVTVKGYTELDGFSDAARRQLDSLDVSRNATVGIGKRRTLRIKDKEIVGYEVLIEGLTAEESIRLQENGLGGRRRFGCGIFIPATAEGR